MHTHRYKPTPPTPPRIRLPSPPPPCIGRLPATLDLALNDTVQTPSRFNATDLRAAPCNVDGTVLNDYVCDALVGAKLADIDISFVYRLFAPKLLCEVFNYQLALVDSLDTNWLRPWVLLTGQYKKCNDFDESWLLQPLGLLRHFIIEPRTLELTAKLRQHWHLNKPVSYQTTLRLPSIPGVVRGTRRRIFLDAYPDNRIELIIDRYRRTQVPRLAVGDVTVDTLKLNTLSPPPSGVRRKHVYVCEEIAYALRAATDVSQCCTP